MNLYLFTHNNIFCLGSLASIIKSNNSIRADEPVQFDVLVQFDDSIHFDDSIQCTKHQGSLRCHAAQRGGVSIELS